MYHVYILFSENLNRFYTGSTNDMPSRFNHYNGGYIVPRKQAFPGIVKLTDVADRKEALQLETKVKKRGAARFLKDLERKLISHGAGAPRSSVRIWPS